MPLRPGPDRGPCYTLPKAMIPLHDDNPISLTPFVTVGPIAACVAVFLWQVSLPPEALAQAI